MYEAENHKAHLVSDCVACDLPTALSKFIAQLHAYADNEYVRGCRISERTECLGREYKLAQGKFREPEYQAHKDFNMRMGAHFGIYEAIAAARKALAACEAVSSDQKPNEGSPASGVLNSESLGEQKS